MNTTERRNYNKAFKLLEYFKKFFPTKYDKIGVVLLLYFGVSYLIMITDYPFLKSIFHDREKEKSIVEFLLIINCPLTFLLDFSILKCKNIYLKFIAVIPCIKLTILYLIALGLVFALGLGDGHGFFPGEDGL
ncbi:hypothetical protein [Xanthocytophaga flava]|uniref:hypothetical protein n=1 Tax=Xanthocytophaga flava TaxID=3048013 RepID=UPI0028D23338|nr:hypothetical protein [Xanthocytophaga flavus]MDJ1471883.1 hypothetical protein [Xanthocytophaga flavus]